MIQILPFDPRMSPLEASESRISSPDPSIPLKPPFQQHQNAQALGDSNGCIQKIHVFVRIQADDSQAIPPCQSHKDIVCPLSLTTSNICDPQGDGFPHPLVSCVIYVGKITATLWLNHDDAESR